VPTAGPTVPSVAYGDVFDTMTLTVVLIVFDRSWPFGADCKTSGTERDPAIEDAEPRCFTFDHRPAVIVLTKVVGL
jgi:hypothetical protein